MDQKPTHEALEQRLNDLEQEIRRLRERERNYRELFNATNDAIFVHQAQTGAILDVNQAMLEMYGYSYEEALQLTVNDLSAGESPYSQAEASQLLRQAMVEGTKVFEWLAKKKNGKRFWVEVALKSSQIGAESLILATVRDISERKAAESERERLIAELTSTNELFYQQQEIQSRLTTQLRTAADISKQLNAILEPDVLLSQIVTLLQQRFNLYHVHVYLLDPASDMLIMQAGSGEVGQKLRQQEHRIPLEQSHSLVARAAREGTIVVVDDVRSEPDFMPNPLLPLTRSEVSVPLLTYDRLIGVLDIQENKAAAFSQADLDTFNTLAGQIAIALQNAALFAERRQVEAALRESEQKFRSIVEQASDAIVICDEQGVIVEWNRAAEQFAGHKRTEMLGKSFWDVQLELMPAEKRTSAAYERFRAIGLAALQTGQAAWLNQQFESEIEHTDGTRRYFQQVTFPIQTAKGFMLGSFSRDITERKLAENILRLRDYAIESSINAIAIADLTGNLSYVNPSFLKLWGYDSEDEVLGKPATSFWFEPAKAEEIVTALANHHSWQGEMLARRKDGASFTAQLSASLVLDAAGQPVNMMASFIDISDQKQAEAEREELITELEAKNAELERFTYTVSHDLKSPLVTIRGFLGLLDKDMARGDAERVAKDLKFIYEATDKMQLILNDLLELSRIGRLVNPPEAVALSELAHEAADLVAGQIAQRGVRLQISPDLPTAYGDRARLLEVFQNLIDNGVKFMGNQPDPQIEIGCRQLDEETVCYVRDNGIGIEPRFHDKIFGLFDRLDPAIDGTGIGLALVRRIVEIHGGRIWVESAGAGTGATFYFTLPVEQKS